MPFARAPSASTTEYSNWSAPAEYSPAWNSNQSGPVLTTTPRAGFDVLTEELHGITVGVDAAERNGDAHRLTRDDPRRHRGGDGLRVRLGVRFADRDRDRRRGELPGRLDAIDGLVRRRRAAGAK